MTPEQTSVSIVLVGVFRPALFTLDELERNQALPATDLAAAKYRALLLDQVVSFALPWGLLTATADRLIVEISQVPYVQGLDLLSRLIRDHAPGSIVTMFGINMTSHYKFPDVAARDAFATRLAPTSPWGGFGRLIEESFPESGDKHGGLIHLTMRHANVDDRESGWIDVKVEPSPLIPNSQGVAMFVNDHFAPAVSADASRVKRATSEELLSLLERIFDQSIERSFKILNSVVSGEAA